VKRLAILLLLLVAVACSDSSPQILAPTGQILLYVDTDSPLPPAPGDPTSPSDPVALFDSVRIEVYAPSATTPCDICTREFALTRGLVEDADASVGIVLPPNTAGYVARVRVFKAAFLIDDEPAEEATLDSWITLPPVNDTGIVEIATTLLVDSVGSPSGSLDAPIAPTPGRPAPRTSTWNNAVRVPCSTTAPPGTACIPGGAYWMGNPSDPSSTDGEASFNPRLVVVSPFYIDSIETTVAAFRQSPVGTPYDPGSWSGSTTGATEMDFCTWTPRVVSAAREALPLMCITSGTSEAYCESVGGALPTEGQYEYVLGGLYDYTFVWGNDPPQCADAVWDRGGVGVYSAYASDCLPAGSIGGVVRAGSGLRDVLVLPDGSKVFDLTANAGEQARDDWNRMTEPCWQSILLVDPLCVSATSVDGAGLKALRGGSWNVDASGLEAAGRNYEATSNVGADRGFRCAYPGD
jgi:formylglycine-generating enzyme required for sulfatase activity